MRQSFCISNVLRMLIDWEKEREGEREGEKSNGKRTGAHMLNIIYNNNRERKVNDREKCAWNTRISSVCTCMDRQASRHSAYQQLCARHTGVFSPCLHYFIKPKCSAREFQAHYKYTAQNITFISVIFIFEDFIIIFKISSRNACFEPCE